MDQNSIDQAVEKAGGRFKLSVLLHKRVRELVRGATPLIPIEGKMNPMDIAMREILQEKLAFDTDLLTDVDILGLKEKKEEEEKE